MKLLKRENVSQFVYSTSLSLFYSCLLLSVVYHDGLVDSCPESVVATMSLVNSSNYLNESFFTASPIIKTRSAYKYFRYELDKVTFCFNFFNVMHQERKWKFSICVFMEPYLINSSCKMCIPFLDFLDLFL